MEYSTLQPWQEIGETGIVHDVGSLYGRFHHIGDLRSAKGKQYSLVMLLVVIFLAKLAGKDKPDEIADWAKNHAEELAELLKLKRAWMPSHNTMPLQSAGTAPREIRSTSMSGQRRGGSTSFAHTDTTSSEQRQRHGLYLEAGDVLG